MRVRRKRKLIKQPELVVKCCKGQIIHCDKTKSKHEVAGTAKANETGRY